MLKQALLIAGMAVLVAACTVGPSYRPPDLPVNGHYATALPVAGSESPVDLDEWWRGFGDPVLTQIVERVLAENLDLTAAQARVAQARAAARGAGAALLPEGSIDGSVARQHQSTVGEFGTVASHLPGYERDQTVRQLGAGASWELDLAGGLRRRAEETKDEAQAAEAAGAGTRIEVVAEAADAYLQVRGAQADLAELAALIAADEDLVRVTADRVREGVAIDRERDDAVARVAQDRALEPAVQARLQAQTLRLDVLMGAVPGSAGVPLGAGLGQAWATPALPRDLHPAQLLRRRPDIVVAERRLAAATAGIGVAVSQYYPDVSLAGILGFERLGPGDLFSAAAFQPALLAGVHWRLFDFGRVDAEVAQARGLRAEALARCRQSVFAAALDAEDALLTLAQWQVRQVALQNVVAADEQAMESVQRSVAAGTASDVEALARRQRLLESRRAWVMAREAHARAVVDAYRALGGGWQGADIVRSGS